MVDGFGTTILLILQLIVGLLGILAVGVIGAHFRSAEFGCPGLRAWSVLSGILRQAEVLQPADRLIRATVRLPAPMRAGPPAAISRRRVGCCQHDQQAAPPGRRFPEPTVASSLPLLP